MREPTRITNFKNKIIEFLGNRPDTRASVISRAIDLHHKETQKLLKELENAGVVARTFYSKSTFYFLS